MRKSLRSIAGLTLSMLFSTSTAWAGQPEPLWVENEHAAQCLSEIVPQLDPMTTAIAVASPLLALKIAGYFDHPPPPPLAVTHDQAWAELGDYFQDTQKIDDDHSYWESFERADTLKKDLKNFPPAIMVRRKHTAFLFTKL